MQQEPAMLTLQQGYGESLVDLARDYPNMIVMTADVARSGNLLPFKEAHPEKFLDVGISEMNMLGMAAGLSTTGFIPVVHSFAMFAVAKPFEVIRNGIAYPNLNVKITATHGGLNVGADGVTHQAIEDVAIMRSLANMTILVPADAVEVGLALRAAVDYTGPVYLRMGRAKTPVVTEPYGFTIGKARVMRDGTDVCLIGNGYLLAKCIEAGARLETEGISAAVVNMHTVKPLDVETVLHFARKTGAFVVAEEHNRIGALGGAVAEVLAGGHPAPMRQVAIDDCFAESGAPAALFAKYGLTVERIVAQARKAMEMKHTEMRR